MALSLITSSDTFGSAFNKVNSNLKQQIISTQMNGNVLELTKLDNTKFTVTIPIPTTGGQVLSPIGSLTLSDSSGLYNKLTVTPVDYLFNSISYSIITPTVIYISDGDSTYDRIDSIYIDTVDNTIKKLNGTPSFTPTLPSIDPNTQLLIGAIYVKALATNILQYYKIIYSAFSSQNILLQIDNGIPIQYLKDLLDVGISTPSNNQLIVYNNSIQKWENKSLNVINGLTNIDQTFKLGGTLIEDTNIDGATKDLNISDVDFLINSDDINYETNNQITRSISSFYIYNKNLDKKSQLYLNGDLFMSVYNSAETILSNLSIKKNELFLSNSDDVNENKLFMSGTNFYIEKNNIKIIDFLQNLIKDKNNKNTFDFLNRKLINNNNIPTVNYNGSNSISILKNGTINCNLNVNNLTTNRTHTFQDKSGTLAHLEDIFSYPVGVINTDVFSLASSAASGSLLRGYKYRFTDYAENAMIDMTDGGVLVRDSMYIEMTAKNNSEFEEYSILNYYNIADWNYATIKFDESLGTTGTITSLQVGSEELLNNNVSYTGIVPFYNLTEYLANEINNSAVTNNTFWRAKSAYNSLLIYNSDNNQFIDTVSISGITPVQIRDFYGDATTHASNMKLKIKYDLNLDYITEIHDEGNLNIVKGSGLLYLNYFNSNFTNNNISNCYFYNVYFSNTSFQNNTILNTGFQYINLENSYFTRNNINNSTIDTISFQDTLFQYNNLDTVTLQYLKITPNLSNTFINNVWNNNSLLNYSYNTTLPFLFINTKWINKRFSFESEIRNLNGSTNAGLMNSKIWITLVPTGFFNTKFMSSGTGLNGNKLRAGIDTDDDDSALTDTNTSALNTIVNSSVTITSKATNIRMFTLLPTLSDITTGSIQVFVEGYTNI